MGLGEIEQASMRLLAVREHSRTELKRKLCARSFDNEAVDEVLDRLIRQRLLSDERFTEQYLSSRQRRGYGPVRIRAELLERGVDGGLIEAYLDESDKSNEEWMTCLRKAHNKKFGVEPPVGLKEKARRVRFLEYRGFSGDQIHTFFRYI